MSEHFRENGTGTATDKRHYVAYSSVSATTFYYEGTEVSYKKNRPTEPLKQYDPKISDIKNMSSLGCCFRSCQNVAEGYLGINLTDDEIRESVTELQSMKSPVHGRPVLGEDMNVNDMNEVITNAFRKLGENSFSARVNWPPNTKEKPIATIIWGDTSSGKQHYTRGDANGHKQFDPGDTETYNEKNLKVFLDKK